MNILVVVAHPDDEVLGMGGTIAKLSEEGHSVWVLIVTDGSTSQYRGDERLIEIMAEKKAETEKACRILGVKEVLYGNLPDMKLDTCAHIEINEVIEKAVDRVEPEVIFTHFYEDVNLDHQMVYKSVLVAARPVAGNCVKGVVLFYTPSSTEWSPQIAESVFLPNYYVDITGTAKKKYEAMIAYKNEMREYPHPRSVKYLEINDMATGQQVGVEKAEAFMIIRYVG